MSRPNVLLIVSEDNGPHLSCYGDPFVQTPHLDRLAAEGVRFEQAFTTQAMCSPGRASILTGLYPHQNGQIGLATCKYAMYQAFANIPSLVKAAGYRTGMIGKLHINPESAFPLDFWWNDKAFISFANRDVRKIAQMADEFILESEQPFFLMVNYPDAHLPFHRQQLGVPETPYDARDVKPLAFVGINTPRLREHTADYYNCMSRLDTGVGLLLDGLKRSGKADDTLVVFTTDHGAQFSRGKTTIYEGGLRVPFVLRWPGVVGEGAVREEMISHIDILPTVLEAVGEDCPPVAGKSILPMCRGEAVRWREYLFAEWCSGDVLTYFPQRSIRDARFKLIVSLLRDRPSPSALGYAGPEQRWEPGATVEEIASADTHIHKAYETYMHPPTEELYDLHNDPQEFVNLAQDAEYASVVKRLGDQLRTWQIETRDALLDPVRLQRLTQEHDTIRSAHYYGNTYPWGRDRNLEWQYIDYLHQA
ncbi:MAG: sulfatase [Candidatus Poribacteria bacterium]|nr:sulfatase [Candidatus Poribacteria bacterium]